MIMLKATLVAMTLIRPWRTSWSADRGVDFSLRPVTRSAPLPTAVGGDPVPAEQAHHHHLDARHRLMHPCAQHQCVGMAGAETARTDGAM
jgi:hypothetical protein